MLSYQLIRSKLIDTYSIRVKRIRSSPLKICMGELLHYYSSTLNDGSIVRAFLFLSLSFLSPFLLLASPPSFLLFMSAQRTHISCRSASAILRSPRRRRKKKEDERRTCLPGTFGFQRFYGFFFHLKKESCTTTSKAHHHRC